MRKYPGSDIRNFEEVVNISKRILSKVAIDYFYSPYSTLPHIHQILGLKSVLEENKNSPYSIASVIPQIKKKSLSREVRELPLNERYLIADEIYDMIAPSLLKDEKNYIDLSINTRYKNGMAHYTKNEVYNFKKILKKKFSILALFMSKLRYKKGDFAQILHYGRHEDLYREHEFLNSISHNVTERWFYNSYPVVNEMVIENFPDKKSESKKSIVGWIIFIANSTEQLLTSGGLRKKKILQGAHLAEKLGARIVSMGGLVASFAKGGHWLSKQIPNVGFTTGHAFTIGNIIKIMDESMKKVDLDIRKSVVAIVGAGGSIGSGCAELVVRKYPKELILIDTSTFIGFRKLKETGQKVKRFSTGSKIILSAKIDDIMKADVIICATNSLYSIIRPKYLKHGTIVIDDSFPKNVDRRILNKKRSVILLEGGITQLPKTIEIYTARDLPDFKDVSMSRCIHRKETYGCLAEGMILALWDHRGNYGLGYADVNLAKDIMSKSKRFRISMAPLQCFGRVINEKRFRKVRKIHNKHYAKRI